MRVALPLLALLLAATACGSSGDPASQSSSPGTGGAGTTSTGAGGATTSSTSTGTGGATTTSTGTGGAGGTSTSTSAGGAGGTSTPTGTGGAGGSAGAGGAGTAGAGGHGGHGGTGVGGAGGALVCDPDQAPLAPIVLEPLVGRSDILPETLTIALSEFSDPDPTDTHGRTEVEIWTVSGGALDQRVWHADVDDPVLLTQLGLVDGFFEGPAAGKGLAKWTAYAVRARYADDRGPCSQLGDWSEPRAFRTDDGSSYLFDPDVVRDFHLTIPPDSVAALNAEAYPPGCKPYSRNYYRGALTFEGVTYDRVGMHIKGGCGSARNLNGKPGMKVTLDWDDPDVPGCPAKRTIYGQKTFTFNNSVQDRSFVHEQLGYALYQAMGVPTPRSTHIRLFINGQLYGVYLHVETINSRFFTRWFGSNKGMAYEGAYWCDLVPANVLPGIDDSGCIQRKSEPTVCDPQQPDEDPMDYELIRTFVQQLAAIPAGQFYDTVPTLFEFDTFLSQWAVESVMSHWDAYTFTIINNWRVYHDPSTGRWTMIPTGIDQTFSTNQDPWAVGGLLAKRCLQEKPCELAFVDRLKKVNALFQAFELPKKAAAIHTLITPYVQADPRKEFDMVAYESAYQKTLDFFVNRPGQLATRMAAHGF